MGERPRHISFALRMIHNQIKDIIVKSVPKTDLAPQSHLQGGILGFLYHHKEEPVYQKDIEREFRISGATATNTLQVMEKNGLIVRKSLDKDARLKRIMMTEEAAAGHERIEAHMRMMDERILKGFSEEETMKLNEYLERITQNLEKMKQEFSNETEATQV